MICGGANNQLTDDGLDDRLQERGILYCPDFVVNSGGVIQVADELARLRLPTRAAKTAQIYDTTLEVLELAASKGVTPTEAASHIAEVRMAAVERGEAPLDERSGGRFSAARPLIAIRRSTAVRRRCAAGGAQRWAVVAAAGQTATMPKARMRATSAAAVSASTPTAAPPTAYVLARWTT